MVGKSRVADVVLSVSPYRKTKIPKALREQAWLKSMGHRFEGKCKVTWCKNKINVFDFQCGHNIPESKGGKTTVENLFPICGRCNMSMGSQYTIDEWNTKFASTGKWWSCFKL
jgi:5-methylcytosine-specific restriction endonuclease McrA